MKKLQHEITQGQEATTPNTWFPNNHEEETSNVCFRIVKNTFLSDYFSVLVYSVLLIHE